MSHVDEGRKYYSSLVDELRDRIEEKGTSFNELSRRSGVDVSSVSRIANGNCIPTFPVLFALYKAIDTEITVGGI